MLSKYSVFCKVLECGNFTKAARELNYSQSAISQSIRHLEEELEVVLFERGKHAITLTPDGEKYLPYLQNIASAEEDLARRKMEIKGLDNSLIKIGAFTSVTRTFLPGLMQSFKEEYPGVQFSIEQGTYDDISSWIKTGRVDFGFLNVAAVSDIETKPIYTDRMMAVVPKGHKLAGKKSVSLKDIAAEPLILLDEGEYSVPLTAFEKEGLIPRIEYKVYDDYSIFVMIKEGLGISLIYETVLEGFNHGLEVLPVKEDVERKMALGFRDMETMSYAAKKFADYIYREVRR